MPTPRMSNHRTREKRVSPWMNSPISGCSATASRWLPQSKLNTTSWEPSPIT